MERVRDTIKQNPTLRNRISSLWATGGMCGYDFRLKTDADIDAGFKTFMQQKCWVNEKIGIYFRY